MNKLRKEINEFIAGIDKNKYLIIDKDIIRNILHIVESSSLQKKSTQSNRKPNASEMAPKQPNLNTNIIQKIEKLNLKNINSIRSLYEKATNAQKVSIRNKVYQLINGNNKNTSIENKIQIYSIFGTNTNLSKLNSIIESTKDTEILKQILQIQPSLDQKVINKVKLLFANDNSNFEKLKNIYKNIGLDDIIDLMQTIVKLPEFEEGEKPELLNLKSLNVNSKKEIKLKNLYYLLKTGKINAIEADIKLTDILDKPQIILLVNRISKTNNITRDLREPIKNIENKIELIPTDGDISVESVQKFARDKLKNKIEQFKSEKLNMFFYGPSGSGKTTMFNAVKSENGSSIGERENVIAFVPQFTFENGKITIKDTILKSTENFTFNYEKFKTRYIRSTPFNKDSSRAHMCTEEDVAFGNKNMKLYDLAGAENPMAILLKTFGFNPFEVMEDSLFGQLNINLVSDTDTADLRLKSAEKPDYLTFKKLYTNYYKYKMFLINSDKNLHKFALIFVVILMFGVTTIGNAKIARGNNEVAKFMYDNKTKTMGELEGTLSHVQVIKDMIIAETDPDKKAHHFTNDTPLLVFLIESFKRSVEGFYIIRSLYMMNYTLSSAALSNSNKIISEFFRKKQETISSESRLPVSDVPDGFTAGVDAGADTAARAPGAPEAKQQPGFTINFLNKPTQRKLASFKDQGQMIVPVPKTGPTYKTALLKYILSLSKGKDGYKNCIVGVINGSAKDDILKQQITAVNYLKTLTVKAMHQAVPMGRGEKQEYPEP